MLEEVVGSALHHAKPALGDRPIRVELPADLPLIPLDGVLIEQVLVNILENAAKYSPPGTPVEIQARHGEKQIVVKVHDRGHGLTPGDERRVLEKFYRGENAVADGRHGVGLGLAICQASSKLTAIRSTPRTVPKEVPGSGSRCRWKGLRPASISMRLRQTDQ